MEMELIKNPVLRSFKEELQLEKDEFLKALETASFVAELRCQFCHQTIPRSTYHSRDVAQAPTAAVQALSEFSFSHT